MSESEALSIQGAADQITNLMPTPDATFDRPKKDGQQADPQPQAASEDRPATDPKPEAPSEPTGDDESEIEYEGEKYRLPSKLKDAFLRQQDYTKKTQELAKQRKEIDEMRTRNDPRTVEELNGKLSKYEQLLGDELLSDMNRDWAKLAHEDPAEYVRQRALADARAQEWQRSQAKRQQEWQDNMRQTLTKEREQLVAKRPEWGDEAKFKADSEKLKGFLHNEGYSAEEISNVTDHRILLIVDKARRFDELSAATAAAAKKIEKLPPKVERPGVPSGSDGQSNREAMHRLKKSGKVEDAAAAISSLLG